MKIGKVSCRLLRIPFTFPLSPREDYTLANLVEVETEDGLKGHAMAAYPMKHAIREFINRDVAPTILGLDALRPELVRHRLFRENGPKFFMGISNCAASLIDIALWDIKGKALGQPVWKLLGGARTKVPAYVTFGLAWYTPEELVEVATTLVREGHTGLKMVVAAGTMKAYGDAFGVPTDDDITLDIERVRVVREAVGPDVALMADANQGASYAQAVRLATLCEPYGLAWLEDPVPQSDPRLMAALRAQTTIPLAAGSTGTSDILILRELLLQGAVSYLQPNVRDIGGYTQAMKGAALAQAFNIPLSMGGNWPHINLHLHAAAPNGGRVEFHWQGWKCMEAVFDGAPEPRGGFVEMPDTPGLGFTPKSGILDLEVQ